MTKLIKNSRHVCDPIQPTVGFLDRNHRATTNKTVTNTRAFYLNVHELPIGSTAIYSTPVNKNDIEKAQISIRNYVSQYSIFVGIYCTVTFEYDDYLRVLIYRVTHDGIRYK